MQTMPSRTGMQKYLKVLTGVLVPPWHAGKKDSKLTLYDRPLNYVRVTDGLELNPVR